MIAKLIAHGRDRPEAFRRMSYALGQLKCLGLTTNLPFLQLLLRQREILEGNYDTHFLERLDGLDRLYDFPQSSLERAAIGLTLFRWLGRKEERQLLSTIPSGWRNNYYQGQRESYRIVESDISLEYRYLDEKFYFQINNTEYVVRLLESNGNELRFEQDGMVFTLEIHCAGDWYYLFLPGTGQLIARGQARFPEVEKQREKGSYDSPMPGEIIKVLARPGDEVAEGDPLLILSSMKMENTISAVESGRILEVYVEEGQQVTAGFLLLKTAPHHQTEEA
jgi:3-methylcrotonyl-CoA carboxylase alpha subunit